MAVVGIERKKRTEKDLQQREDSQGRNQWPRKLIKRVADLIKAEARVTRFIDILILKVVVHLEQIVKSIFHPHRPVVVGLLVLNHGSSMGRYHFTVINAN